jgi:hypothetical protein
MRKWFLLAAAAAVAALSSRPPKLLCQSRLFSLADQTTRGRQARPKNRTEGLWGWGLVCIGDAGWMDGWMGDTKLRLTQPSAKTDWQVLIAEESAASEFPALTEDGYRRSRVPLYLFRIVETQEDRGKASSVRWRKYRQWFRMLISHSSIPSEASIGFPGQQRRLFTQYS